MCPEPLEVVEHRLQHLRRVALPVLLLGDDAHRVTGAVGAGDVAGEALVRDVRVVLEGSGGFHDVDAPPFLDPGERACQLRAPHRRLEQRGEVHVVGDAAVLVVRAVPGTDVAVRVLTESEALGISRNPWDPDRTPGGSSSGAGVAVAAGMAPIAHGGDGGGSIRIPASCTGLVGLKPTRGRVTDEVVDLEGLATHGVLTRTVADTAAALDVLARHDPAAWWSPPATAPGSFQQALAAGLPAGLRIGVLTGSPIEGVSVDPVCVAAVEATAAALEDAGSHLVDQPLTLPPAEELIGAFTTMWNVGGAGYEVDDPERVEPHNRVLREAARAVDAWSYAQAIREAQRLSRRIVEEFTNNVDLLLTPTMACLPPPIGAWRPGTDADPLMALVNSYPMAIFTSLFNVTGQPAISVPVAHDRGSDLPVGVQLVAAPWAEGLLLQVARLLEVTFPWAHRRPGAG